MANEASYRWRFNYPATPAIRYFAAYHNGSLTIIPEGETAEGISLIQVRAESVEYARLFMQQLGISAAQLSESEHADP